MDLNKLLSDEKNDLKKPIEIKSGFY